MSKTPCENCPFRSDRPFNGLSEEKMDDIVNGLMRDAGFHCHKTVDYSDGSGNGKVTEASALCTGAAIFLEKCRPGGLRSNLAFRIEVMFKKLSVSELSDEVPVYNSIKAFKQGAGLFVPKKRVYKKKKQGLRI